MENHIGKKVKVNKYNGTVIKQHGNYILVEFESGSKICFNSYTFTDKNWR